jgi:acyl carrier protein
MHRITKLISKYTKKKEAEITDENTHLLSDLGLESMDFIELMCDIESEYKIKIPERDFRKLVTVKGITQYIYTKNVKLKPLVTAREALETAVLPITQDRIEVELPLCTVQSVNAVNIEKIPALVRAVYGEEYPAKYLYTPHELMEKIRAEEVYSFVALAGNGNGSGKACGMVSLIRLKTNPRAFELGHLMVRPELRNSDIANLLSEHISCVELEHDTVISECVTTHLFSQRSCSLSGFTETAIKLNIMEQTGAKTRVSVVVAYKENPVTPINVYLPKEYRGEVKLCYDGLTGSNRIFREIGDVKPMRNTPFELATQYEINDYELSTSQFVVVTVTEIGSSLEMFADFAVQIEEYAERNKVKSMLIKLPMTSHNWGKAAKLLSENGYFFTGIMPMWLPSTDCAIMQKLWDTAPDWQNIKLFTEKSKQIARLVVSQLAKQKT